MKIKIVLDAGHGLPDGGAVNTNGLSEAEIKLSAVEVYNGDNYPKFGFGF